MVEQTIGRLPEQWRELTALLLAPIVCVLRLQALLIDYLGDTPSGWGAAVTYGLLALPGLLGLAAIWCTQLSLYTLPFRSRRTHFLAAVVMMWWGAVVAVWLYWVGIIRTLLVLLWWLLTGVRLVVKLAAEAALQFVLRPLSAMGRLSDDYLQPGVPWVAVSLLISWCALEATLFTYTMRPTLSQSLADLFGQEPVLRSAGPLVWVFLFLLALGSFVCIQVLIDALKRRAISFIVLSVVVELFVMFFEVGFLYRPLAEAIMPWIVQQTGPRFRPSAWFTFSVARFGWTAVRGMAWLLFGQYGTPPLLRLLSRLTRADDPAPRGAGRPIVTPAPSSDFTTHVGWLQIMAERLLEYLILPMLQLITAALNFVMVMVAAQPLFTAPVRGVREALGPDTAQQRVAARSS